MGKEGMIPEEEMKRILDLISVLELTLYHPIIDDTARIWKSHLAMIEKRGGNLCAPVPMPLGKCGYINDIEAETMRARVAEYKAICAKYPRAGMGVDPHCTEVGLEDPQAKKENPMKAEEERFVVTPVDQAVVSMAKVCNAVKSDKAAQSDIRDAQKIMEGMSTMAVKYSQQPSADLQKITAETAKSNPMWKELAEKSSTSRLMEAEMLSGQLEGQLLQFLARMLNVKTALDIGTFTGYSALALAEVLPEGGKVVTLEREADAARLAVQNWADSPHKSKINSLVGEASALLAN